MRAATAVLCAGVAATSVQAQEELVAATQQYELFMASKKERLTKALKAAA